ncbi:cupin domain-containing protein [Actinacidiphila alni]|uniref:cupin domain-containing protein n=1 Tax=Actinacidiphila alni TaxID=380248 RepID=UPI00345614C1
MEIFRFDRDERLVTHFGSSGLLATRVAEGEGAVRVTHLKVAPGGVIGAHAASVPQMFLVISGRGWVAGPGGGRTAIAAGQGVRWERGEEHTSGTEEGFTALAIEGAPLALFASGTGPEPENAPGARD